MAQTEFTRPEATRSEPTHYKQFTRSTVERVYVKVNSDCDTTGQIHPKSITWADGRTFSIDTVRDFRPANTVGADLPGDCYTVVIAGHEKHLFFERIDPRFTGRLGRWFVEKIVAVPVCKAESVREVSGRH